MTKEITVIDDAKELHELTHTLNKHVKDVKMVATAKLLLCGAVVKEMLTKRSIKGKEKEYFDNSTEMAYSTAVHAKHCQELYGDIVVMGSGLENIGPAKLIKLIPLARGMDKEARAKLLSDFMQLRGDDINLRYLELKGEAIEPPCLCETYKKIEIEVCERCEKPKKEAKQKTYKIRTGQVVEK